MVRFARWPLVLLLLTCAAGRAGAEDDAVERAKMFFFEGKKEFEQQHYEVAYRWFERSYQSSPRPALLFNMATCLSALDRPREAAAKLRDYLDHMPNDPGRAAIEESIRGLSQRAAEQGGGNDQERAALEARIRVLEQRLNADSQVVAAPPPRRSHRGLAIGLGVTAGVVIAGVAITLGLVLGHGPNYTPSSFGGGPLQSTR